MFDLGRITDVDVGLTGYGQHMRTIVAIALGLLLSLGLVTPAQAEIEDAEPLARVVYPLPPNNARGTLVKVQIEGPADDWGLRQFAEKMDDRWPGLRVRSHGTCDERPAWVCVQVVVGDWNPEEQVALTGMTFMATTYNSGYDRPVYLNAYYAPSDPYVVAAHEFGHVLGLNHHMQDGVCGAIPDVTELSWAEDKALRPYYGRAMTG